MRLVSAARFTGSMIWWLAFPGFRCRFTLGYSLTPALQAGTNSKPLPVKVTCVLAGATSVPVSE